MKKISYLGPEGTFTEEALKRYRSKFNEEYIKVPCDTIEDAIALCRTEVDYAVVPVENSLGGSVLTTMDYLMEHDDIQIVREIVMPIAHYLYGLENIDLSKMEMVHSHPQALRQCSKFLQNNMLKAHLAMQNSTAESAQQILSLGNPHHCLIGSLALEDTYPLKRLAGPIQNNPDNWTRFLLLKLKDEAEIFKAQGNKLSLICQLDGLRPGALYEALSIFAYKQINLVHIESRPLGRRLGEYKFFLDLEIVDPNNVKEAIDELEKIAHNINVMGIYPQENL